MEPPGSPSPGAGHPDLTELAGSYPFQVSRTRRLGVYAGTLFFTCTTVHVVAEGDTAGLAFAAVSAVILAATAIHLMWIHRPATTVVDEQGVHTRPFFTEHHSSWQQVVHIGPPRARQARWAVLQPRHGRLTSLLGLDPATAGELGLRLSSLAHRAGGRAADAPLSGRERPGEVPSGWPLLTQREPLTDTHAGSSQTVIRSAWSGLDTPPG